MNGTEATFEGVLSQTVRTHVTEEQKRQLQDIARRRQLRDADIFREALRVYLRLEESGQLNGITGELERDLQPA